MRHIQKKTQFELLQFYFSPSGSKSTLLLLADAFTDRSQ